MREWGEKEYRNFLKSHNQVEIGSVTVSLPHPHPIKSLAPKDFKLEATTVWSFPSRGDWATHRGNYRGNWSPYIPRNLILRYTNPGDTVLDQMSGSGTTAVECKLLGRNCIAVDINPDAIVVTRNRLDFPYNPLDEKYVPPEITTFVGDARSLDRIPDNSIDLIATHPPYANIIPYSHKRVEGDLSSVHDINEFTREMTKVAEESYRVLKPGRHCAILMGDTRKHLHYIPIAPRVLESFLEAGFILRENIIKLQHQMLSSRQRWRAAQYDFLKIAHENLFIFRKPGEKESIKKFKHSVGWHRK